MIVPLCSGRNGFGLGLQAGQVAPRAGLRIALAPADFPARDFGEEPLLLAFCAEMQQRRAEHPDTK
jgi:hypothetical protein